MDSQVATALTSLIANLKDLSPELRDVLDKAKRGEIDEITAMTCLMETVQGDPALAAKLQNLAMNTLAPLREGEKVEVPHDVFVPRDGKGLTRMNPLYEGALIERAQFDGDMPELRTGDIPNGMAPAVPVKTMARNPVAIGAMLTKASDKMRDELTTRTQERRQLADAVAAGGTNAIALIRQHGALMTASGDAGAIVQGTAQSDPEGYRRGELPQLATVMRPRGSALTKMTDGDRHELAWKFLSTTQGRRSAVLVIRDLVATHLLAKGITVEERDFDPRAPREQPLAYRDWSIMLSGPGATQPAFALVDIAAKSLAIGLVKDIGDDKPAMVYLEVTPIDQVDERSAGWMARLMPYG